MGNLIKSDDLGNWGIKGLPWKNLYVGNVITREIHEKLYGCLCKLKDYEETGLSPDQVEELQCKNEWIPCSERLPASKGWYQCSCIVHGQEMVRDLYFYPGRKQFIDNIRYSENACQNIEKFVWHQYVKAWKPLPEPYKEK